VLPLEARAVGVGIEATTDLSILSSGPGLANLAKVRDGSSEARHDDRSLLNISWCVFVDSTRARMIVVLMAGKDSGGGHRGRRLAAGACGDDGFGRRDSTVRD
jgi:hypothetical protein